MHFERLRRFTYANVQNLNFESHLMAINEEYETMLSDLSDDSSEIDDEHDIVVKEVNPGITF